MKPGKSVLPTNFNNFLQEAYIWQRCALHTVFPK